HTLRPGLIRSVGAAPCARPRCHLLQSHHSHVPFQGVPSRRLLDLAGGVSGVVTLPVQAARSMGVTASGSARVCRPSILRMVIWPEASSAQNSIAAVSAEGSTVCVLIRRLNSSCNRSIAFVVRADF